ncbi:MAG: TolC family protein [Planctomyces sp.]
MTSAVLALILSSVPGCRYPHGLAQRFVTPGNLSSLRIISPLQNSQVTVPDVPKRPVDADTVTTDQQGHPDGPDDIEQPENSERMDVTEGNDDDAQDDHEKAGEVRDDPSVIRDSGSDGDDERTQRDLPATESSAETETSIPLDIAEARAGAIVGNIDLKIERVEPTLARERISEEAGRFQTTLELPIQRNQIHPPSGGYFSGAVGSGIADGNVETVFDRVSPGINVPLTTGGNVLIEQPINRLDSPLTGETIDSQLGFSFTQPLLSGRGVRVNTAGIRIAHTETSKATATAKLAAIKVLGDVERAYWNLYLRQSLRTIAVQQLEIARKQHSDARRLAEEEVVAEIDVERAATGFYSRKATWFEADVNARIAGRELKRIMQKEDLSVDSPVEIRTTTDPHPGKLSFDREQQCRFAIDNRMEMFELQMQLLANAITQEVQENAKLPQLDLIAQTALLGNGGTLGRSYEDLFGSGHNTWTIGANLSVPLPGGSDQQAVARARQNALRRLQLALNQDRLRVLIRQEVNDAIDRIEASWNRVQAAGSAVRSASRAYFGELRQYQLGQRTSTDVLIAADRLAEGQADEVSAMADFEIARVDLAVATGTTLSFSQVQWTPLSVR